VRLLSFSLLLAACACACRAYLVKRTGSLVLALTTVRRAAFLSTSAVWVLCLPLRACVAAGDAGGGILLLATSARNDGSVSSRQDVPPPPHTPSSGSRRWLARDAQNGMARRLSNAGRGGLLRTRVPHTPRRARTVSPDIPAPTFLLHANMPGVPAVLILLAICCIW